MSAVLAPSLGMGAIAPAARLEQAPVIAHETRIAPPQHALVGYGTILGVMRFMRWAIERDSFPSVAAVMDEFQVCRATAYRWTYALAEVYGLDPATRHGGRRS